MTEEITVAAAGGSNQPPADIQEKAKLVEEQITARILERTKIWKEKKLAAAKTAKPMAADVVLASGYQYWNVLTDGPYQDFDDPPYRPSKVIAWGEAAVLWAGIWINPLPSDGGGLSGTTVLGGRNYNAYFESINLTNVTDGPDLHRIGTFAGPAPVITWLGWWFDPSDPTNYFPDPGPKPQLYEVHFTIDIEDAGQPLAAFNTWHYDPDFEPEFFADDPFVPPVPFTGPGLQHDIPVRFLVYHK
jgi:hypothetical protein